MFLLVAGPFVSWLPIVAWWPGLAGIKAGHRFLYWGPCFSGGGGPSDLVRCDLASLPSPDAVKSV